MSEKRAIDTNSLNGNAFPVNIDFSSKRGVWRVFFVPLSVLEVIDFISQETFLVFNVDHYNYVDLKTLSLEEVASNHSAYLKKFDDETLLMDKKSVTRLLREMPHYNFCLIDIGKEA